MDILAAVMKRMHTTRLGSSGLKHSRSYWETTHCILFVEATVSILSVLSRKPIVNDPVWHFVTHTHSRPFNGPLSRTTRVSRYQKGKTSLDFIEAWDMWQWHQLGHMQVCTSLQTDNPRQHPTAQFFTGQMPLLLRQPTVSKHWRQATLRHQWWANWPMGCMWSASELYAPCKVSWEYCIESNPSKHWCALSWQVYSVPFVVIFLNAIV